MIEFFTKYSKELAILLIALFIFLSTIIPYFVITVILIVIYFVAKNEEL